MAFTLPLTLNGEAQAAAYVKATIARCDTTTTVVKLDVWTTQASRTNEGKPVPSDWLPDDFVELAVLTTDMELQSNNPLDYGYKLLEASGMFPAATWNV